MRVLMVAPTPFFGDRGCHIRILEEVRALRGLGVETLVATYAVGRDHPRFGRSAPRVPWVKTLPSASRPIGPIWMDSSSARRSGRPGAPGHPARPSPRGRGDRRGRGAAVRRPAVADLQGSVAGEMIAHGHLPAGGPIPAAPRRRACGPPLARPAAPVLRQFRARPRRRLGAPPERVVLLADGIDPEFLRPGPAPDALREQLGLVGKRVVVFLGVLTEYQGIDDLLTAWPQVMAAVPDAHLLLMGHLSSDTAPGRPS